MKIAIIEDDESIGLALETALTFEGFETILIIRAEDSLSAIKKYNPDIILLDYLLSGTDGKVVASILKNNPSTKHIPIILMSADPTAKKVAKDMDLQGFLAKPFTIDKMLKTLQGFRNR